MSLLLLTGGGTPTPPPPVEPENLTARRQITTSSLQTGKFYPSAGAAQTYAYTYTITATCKDLVVSVDASVSAGKASIVAGGTTYPLTFSGGEGFAHTGSPIPVYSDPLPITLEAGSTITGRLFYEAAAGQHPAAKSLGHNPAFWGPGDGTATGAGIVSQNNSQRFLPTFVSITGLSSPTTVSVIGTGDSILESGSGTPTGYTRGVTEAIKGFLNAGRWGGQTITQGDVAIPDLADYTHVLDQYGFNDITNEAVTKTMADKILTWDWLHSRNDALKITACTVTPSASSTDSWTTLENQTPDAGTTYGGLTRWQRTIVYNNWMRDGAPILAGVAAPDTTDPAALRSGQAGHPLRGYLEIADVIESARDSGKFRVDVGQVAIDGAHMQTLGGTLTAAVVKPWAESLTV